MAQLGGELFATRGNVDSYFNLNHCGDKFEDGTGRVFVCDLIKGHVGAHEDESMEWWNEESPAIKIHPGLIAGKSIPFERDVEREKQIIDETIHEVMDIPEDSLACPAENEEALRAVRIQTRVAEHLMSAANREAKTLRMWHLGWLDGAEHVLVRWEAANRTRGWWRR